jgi:hypothetical protein
MRRSKWFLLVSFVLISSMLAWACGGGGEEKPSGPTAPAATSPAGKTPAAGETPTVGETPEAQAGGGEFSGLADKFGKATFKVTYQLSGGGAAATQGSMIWYKKGDNLRMDIAGEVAGQQGNVILIILPDTTYYCTSAPEMGESGTCFSAPSEAGQGVSQTAADLEKTLTDPNLEVVSTSSRSIAGEDAKCYTVRSPDIEGEAELCMSGDGVPLFSKETVQGAETTMEATDFSHNVSDSDFEPPYPVSAMPSGAGNP